PALYLAHNANSIETDGVWYRRFQLEKERQRGLEFEEDLFNPCTLSYQLSEKQAATVIASTERRDAADAEPLVAKEITRRESVAMTSPVDSEMGRTLALAADQFIVQRGDQKTVIAGYHW